ncbi:barstar family protein [Pontibacter liquoris]|uniref:barstar family protein n=1 Tax=Pontibacter liquoris TaxID=2905677 RepID=UPI001FA78191|nr:barstar family protein [Pontibacter liquoris]
MAAFRNEPEEWQRLDWQILQNGWSCLYHRPEFLLIDIAWFRKERYRVLEFDCSKWTDKETLHTDLQLKFRLSTDYESHDLAALRNALAEYAITGGGLVVVLHHFDTVKRKTGQALLDVLAENARYHLLLGERVLTLVQLDKHEDKYTTPAASPLPWNPHEWLDASGKKK